ncbi:polysaccharide biosynthesis tyrosine autokinase [Pontiellaceae bacterium B12227]|nr:polysaccharide biosynthesis tyrosine autokinase [Pontiellaceae bacterium B12227]
MQMKSEDSEHAKVRPMGPPPSIGEGAPAASGSILAPMNLLRIVLHRWLLVILCTIMGGLAGIVYIQQATPIYVAEAQLEMSVRRPRVTNSEAVFDDSNAGDSDSIFNTRFAKFKSPAMERLVAREYIKRYPPEDARGSSAVGPETLADCLPYVTWYKDSSADIVYVSYKDSDPEFAAQLVNVLTYCAGVLMMEENQALSDEAVKWLVSQVQEQKDSLEKVETQLAATRLDFRLDSLEQRKTAIGQSLLAVSLEKDQFASQLSSRKAVYEFVSGLKEADPNLEILPSGLPKEEQLNELIRGWRSANDELLAIADRYTEIHPEYRAAAEREARSRERLKQFIDMSTKSVLSEIELLEKQVSQVDERIKILNSEALELEKQVVSGAQRLQSLERQRDAADNAYQTMLRRVEEARLSADENMAFTKVIRTATVPRFPVSPIKSKAIASSIFLGMAVGCAMAILLALFIDRIESVTDLKALGLNILGTIPSEKKIVYRDELATIGLRDKFHHIVEIFAGINSLIMSDKYKSHTQVVLMSSVEPGEGKTISACNLAISSALNGARTLLIDGDLRRPQLATVFKIDESQPSLLEWLSNDQSDLTCAELVSHDIITGLDVISSKKNRHINPAELMGRSRPSELIAWARKKYDRVIIDSAPLGPVVDARVIANQVDSIIVVSRLGKTSRRRLKFALKKFHEIDAHVLGCIANDVSHSLAGLFDGAEGYGGGYGGSYKAYGRDD